MSSGAKWVLAARCLPLALTLLLLVPVGSVGGLRSGTASEPTACPSLAPPQCTLLAPVPAVHPATSNFSGNWSELYPSSAPSIRTQPAIAYDPAIQSVVLFGGYDPSVVALSDTWTFANNTWTQISTNLTASPPARWGASMVWDAADGYLVLFGGRNTGAYLNDTWTFNGTAWTNVTTSVAPPSRSLFEMAYDPVDGKVIVDGGARLDFTNYTWQTVNDTWAYSAGSWTNISASLPGGALDRAAGQGAYDPWNGSVVFVGGGSTVNWTAGCTPIDPVQTYVNGTWYEYPTSVGPPDLSQEMLTYDAAGPYLFLFGGFEPTGGSPGGTCIQTDSTWIRSDGVWYNVTGSLSLSPSLRYLSGIAFDPVLGEVVLFGGNGNGAYLNDTWVFRIPSLVTDLKESRTEGAAPMVVEFHADTVGGAAVHGYNWSFGDGGTSTLGPYVNHTFESPGVFNVTVNVSGASGSFYATSGFVTVSPPLSLVASASQLVGSVPLNVTFNASVAGGFAPYRYSWSFGDGSTSLLPNVTHLYSVAGNFTATLTVIDHAGDSNQSSIRITVGAQLATVASASVVAGETPLWVNFSSSTAGGTGADTYAWNFGDGGTSAAADPTHEYVTAGNYTAVLVVTDTLGRTAASSVQVRAYPPIVATVQAIDLTGLAPFSLTLLADVGGGDAPYTCSWNFGDGSSPELGTSVGHTYVEPGTYSVRLFVNDSLGEPAGALAPVHVVAPLVAKLAVSGTTGESPAPISFSFATFSGGEAPYTFAWTFGDGTTATGGAGANHTYAHEGVFLAKVVVGDALNELVSVSATITVLPPVSLAIVSGFGNDYAGSPVNLTVRASGGATPFSYRWSGLPKSCATENDSTLECIPVVAAAYNVTVVVTDGYGRSAQANGTLLVEASVSPSLPSPASGGSFPIWYAVVGFVGAAVAVAAIAYWAGRRRATSGLGPASVPDLAPDDYNGTPEGEAFAGSGGPPGEP